MDAADYLTAYAVTTALLAAVLAWQTWRIRVLARAVGAIARELRARESDPVPPTVH